jgi:hypothetical protein
MDVRMAIMTVIMSILTGNVFMHPFVDIDVVVDQAEAGTPSEAGFRAGAEPPPTYIR